MAIIRVNISTMKAIGNSNFASKFLITTYSTGATFRRHTLYYEVAQPIRTQFYRVGPKHYYFVGHLTTKKGTLGQLQTNTPGLL